MRRIEEQNVRKIIKLNKSYATTLPIGVIRELKWQEGQKLVVEKRGKGIYIQDWPK
jgi:bifunctional DNA-binding transcriptional regulator/antitoxin component of YhaV-PrlF toxin-antitoxin module